MIKRGVIIFCFVSVIIAQFQDHCHLQHLDGRRGHCTRIANCPYAMQQLQQSIKPELCGFIRFDPIVCCPLSETDNNDRKSPLFRTSIGTISDKKCKEYTEKPADREQTFHITVVGGEEATAKEFPHMAVLGYGNKSDIQWLCAGSLISENFVLTAAHCLNSPEFGEIKFARLGDLNIRSTEDEADPQDFEIAKIIRFPEYSPPLQYHDIALLELDRAIEFSEYVRPACVHTKTAIPANAVLIATGWGKTQTVGDVSDHLMKVDLSVFPNNQCRNSYVDVPKRRLPNGIVENSQLCAGGIDEQKDTCQGDSGGPLQYKHPEFRKQYIVVGITSFGKACGIKNVPGVYTRVSQYISWIEGTVWPNQQ